jgi:hypothetical protein
MVAPSLISALVTVFPSSRFTPKFQPRKSVGLPNPISGTLNAVGPFAPRERGLIAKLGQPDNLFIRDQSLPKCISAKSSWTT